MRFIVLLWLACAIIASASLISCSEPASPIADADTADLERQRAEWHAMQAERNPKPGIIRCRDGEHAEIVILPSHPYLASCEPNEPLAPKLSQSERHAQPNAAPA